MDHRELLNYPAISTTAMRGWRVLGFGIATLGVCVLCVQIWRGSIVGNADAPLWLIGVIGITFGVVGVMMIIYGIMDVQSDRRKRRAALTHPGEPWRGDYDWSRAASPQGMGSRDSARWWVHTLGLAALLSLAAISNWLAYDAWGGGLDAWFLVFMAFVMDLIVLVFVGIALRRLVMRARFGSPRVVFDRVPVRPGEMLGARMIARGLDRAGRVVVTLRDVGEVYSERRRGRGNKPRIVIECVELDAFEQVIDDVASRIAKDGTLAIEFRIPEHAASSALSERPARFWDIEVRAEMRGVDFVHRFAAPVYRAAGSS